MQLLTDAQKGYIAGCIDGEGCIYITKVKSKNTKCGFEFHWGCEITNTDIGIFQGRTHLPHNTRDAVLDMKMKFCESMHELNRTGLDNPPCSCVSEAQIEVNAPNA